MGDIKNPKLIYFKGFLFLLTGLFAAGILLLERFSWQDAFLLGVTVWSFARFYYFAFYVIEHYVDGSFRFAGLGAFALYVLRRHGQAGDKVPPPKSRIKAAPSCRFVGTAEEAACRQNGWSLWCFAARGSGANVYAAVIGQWQQHRYQTLVSLCRLLQQRGRCSHAPLSLRDQSRAHARRNRPCSHSVPPSSRLPDDDLRWHLRHPVCRIVSYCRQIPRRTGGRQTGFL